MDISTLIIIIIVFSVLGSIATVVFWGGIAFLGIKAVQNYQKQMNLMMSNYKSTLSDMQHTYGDEIPPEAQQQLFTQYMQMQNQLNQFDNLSRQKHDLFVSDMRGQASSVGIDVSSWN